MRSQSIAVLPLKLEHWTPETIYLEYKEFTKVVLIDAVSDIREFRLKQDKSNLHKKAARRHICFLNLAPLSRVSLARDARQWPAPRARKLVPATLNGDFAKKPFVAFLRKKYVYVVDLFFHLICSWPFFICKPSGNLEIIANFKKTWCLKLQTWLDKPYAPFK